jgi:hypothetical protein
MPPVGLAVQQEALCRKWSGGVTIRPILEVMISSVFLLGLVTCGRQGRDPGQGTSGQEAGSPTNLFLKTSVDYKIKKLPTSCSL